MGKEDPCCKYFLDLAARLENGKDLSEVERRQAAGAIRAFAKAIPVAERRGRGRPGRVDGWLVALQYVHFRKEGDKHASAVLELMRLHKASKSTVEDYVKKYRKGW